MTTTKIEWVSSYYNRYIFERGACLKTNNWNRNAFDPDEYRESTPDMLTIHINRNQARILAETLIASALCAIGRKVAEIFKKKKEQKSIERQ